jgi:hypothetical protein
MDIWNSVAWISTRQHLLITTWQLGLLGLSDSAIDARIQLHGWKRVAPHVIALPGKMTPLRRLAAVLLSLAPAHGADLRVEEHVAGGLTRYEAMVYAALGAGQAVCGRSALWLHGITSAPRRSWVRVPNKSAGSSSRKDALVRYGPCQGAIVWLEGLPVVAVEQAFMDVPGGRDHQSALWLHHDLCKLIATAIAKRLTTLEDLQKVMEAGPRFVGVAALRRVLQDLRGELPHSDTERKARRIATEVLAVHDLQLQPRPHTVEVSGRPIGEADLPVLAILLDIEIDGPHHRLAEQQEKDRLRDRRMRRAGWEIERFPTELIDLSPQRFRAELDECVRARLAAVTPTRNSSPGRGISRRNG